MTSPAWKVGEVLAMLALPLLVAGGLVLVERRFLGQMQDRYGPNRVGIFGEMQVMADAIKLLAKEDWIPPFADRPVFVGAPAVILSSVLASFVVIPLTDGFVVANLNVGLLFFLGMSSLGVYSIALAGWSSHSKYPLLGGLRASAQMLGYEVFMGMSLLGVVMMAGSFNLSTIVEGQRGLWYIVPQFVGFMVFLVAGLAETRRTPFDLPEAESELVAGYHVEYSAMKFGSFYVGEYLGITLISSLITVLFLGGWLGPILPGWLWFLVKMSVMILVIILIRGALPRFRYDQLMGLGWKVMLPLALVNLLVTAAVILAT
jgi:NADH-quinone oxidoreductase subunit H